MGFKRESSVCCWVKVGLAVLFALSSAGTAFGADFEILVFSKTLGFRHDSIPNGITMIQNLAAANNFTATFTEDSNLFNTANLAQYEAVVFLNTTGDVLDGTQQAAFQAYIESNKGYVGIHSASDTLHSWSWYGNLVGAFFVDHPAGTPTATVEVADRVFPATTILPKYWVRTDEWYNFDRNPRGTVHVLATVDEGTYSGGTMGYDHPISWCQRYDGGRSFYTACGHTQASYSELNFQNHVLNGIKWAAGVIGGDASAGVYANYQKVVLDSNVSEPMSLSVAPDNRVFFIERGGSVKIYKPSTQSTVTAGVLSVTTANEDGGLGIALDPNFATNQWVYVMYSPVSVVEQRISRFTMSGDSMNMGSEVILLQIPTQRTNCCHSAGSLAFGNNGQLFISTGDNTNPFDSSGYAPIDEQPGRSDWDAQKSASNRNDLRGKILRIVPQANGTYTIPAGNLFPSDGSNGRPEVYVMGCRNPFRISVDTETGWLYWGEVGPDSGADSSSRGPKGYDEVNQARAAGNFGWPYCIANNLAYKDYNFATGVSGSNFNCAAPTNNSPNNTGSQSLPASQGAFIWYPHSASSQFPEMDGASPSGSTIMSGPVYHYNAGASSPAKIPAYFDDTLFVFEWSRNYINEVKLDDSGNILKINPFVKTMTLGQPIEMEFGPDGCMYMIEWNPAKLIRIEFVTTGNLSPVAVASVTPDTGLPSLTVTFSSAGSFDPDGTVISYEWDFTTDGSTDSTATNPTFTYTTSGNYSARLTVRDNVGATAVANVPIVVGNNKPVVTITKPVNGGFFDWSSTIPTQVSVTDVQDGSTGAGTIPCPSVVLQTYLGHDSHAHPMGQFSGCTGSFTTASDQGHDLNENLYYIFEARYTDLGGPGAGPLTTIAQSILQPKRKQAENYTTQSGIQFENCDDVDGGEDAGFIDNGDYISFNPMNLQNITTITCRVASPANGANIEVHVDSPTGTIISTVPVPVTGGWQTWVDSTASINNPGGAHHLYFVFKPSQTGLQMNLNWINFNGDGVTAANTVSYDLGSPDVANLMTHPQPTDGHTVATTIGAKSCKKNTLVGTDYYFFFAVDDSYALNGNHPTQYITIDYYNTGTGTIDLQYDATSNIFKSAGTVTLTNTNTWKQFQWAVTDAYFGNRQSNGADFRIGTGGSITRYIDLVTVSTNPLQGAQTPYPGTAFTIPGTIQAEQYDLGGQGVAYSDGTNGNSGGQFRTDNVDIETTADAGGSYDVTSMDAGEWLEYTVSVPATGTYNIGMRVASPSAGGAYHIEMGTTNATGSKTIPNTGGAQTWTTTTATNVSLTVGQQVLRVYVEVGGWNFNYMDITATSQTPFGGTATTVPGTVQGENYDVGGENFAYHDLSAGNSGGQYRSDGVDVETCTDSGGGYDVGYIDTGEWLEYTVNVIVAGSYYFNARVASPNTGGAFHIEVNGTNVTGSKTVPNTGGWQTWTTVTSPNISLNAGQQIVRMVIEVGAWNFNYITVQTAPGMASLPNPANGATGVSNTPLLSWTTGSSTTSHDVYFGTVSPGAFQGNQAGTTFNPGTLSPGISYYWRIDEKNSNGTTTGTVWSFITGVPPGQSTDPSPVSGITGLGTTVNLTWTAGSNATSQDVYFGTTSPGTFQGNQTDAFFNPPTLSPGTTYYWRVDARNAVSVTTGPVWTLKTAAVPPADFDGDGDVDSSDFGHLQNCLNGVAQPVPLGCEDADLNLNGSVDSADFSVFLPCMAGPNHAPGC